MISSISSFELSVQPFAVLCSKDAAIQFFIYLFILIAAYFADAAAVNPNGTKMLLESCVITFFINGKPIDINCLRKLRNPSWLPNFLALPVNRTPLFFEKLISFEISFISLFVRVIPKPVIYEIPVLMFLPIILNPVSTRRLLLHSLGFISFNFFQMNLLLSLSF